MRLRRLHRRLHRHAHNLLEVLWGHAHLSSRSFQLLSFVTKSLGQLALAEGVRDSGEL